MNRDDVENLLAAYFGVRPVPGQDVAPLGLPLAIAAQDSPSGFLTVVHSDISYQAQNLCQAMTQANKAIGWVEFQNDGFDPNYLVILIQAEELINYNQVFFIAEHQSYRGCKLSAYPHWAKNENGKPKMMYAGHEVPYA